MKKAFLLLTLVFAVSLVSGCASQQQHLAKSYLDDAQNAASYGNYTVAFWKIDQVLMRGDKDLVEHAKELIAQESFGRGIEQQLINRTNEYFSFDALHDFENVLDRLKDYNAYIAQNIGSIQSRMHENVKKMVSNGTVPVTFQDIKQFDYLRDKEIFSKAYATSVEKLKEETNPLLLEATLEGIQDPLCISCVEKFKKDSKNFKYNKSMTENKQLASLVGKKTISTAAEAIPALFVSFDQNDRLMELDVMAALADNEYLRIVPSVGKNTYTVKVAKLAYEERVIPEHAQTIVYDYYQCDPMLAILFMPRNASYMYEYVTSEASVEYAYELTLYKGKQKIANKLVRDTVRDSASYCRNARVQNVFGGISPASFTANAHMQAQCAGGAQRNVTASLLKESVQNALVGAIVTLLAEQN